jgi:hypothetical protein
VCYLPNVFARDNTDGDDNAKCDIHGDTITAICYTDDDTNGPGCSYLWR